MSETTELKREVRRLTEAVKILQQSLKEETRARRSTYADLRARQDALEGNLVPNQTSNHAFEWKLAEVHASGSGSGALLSSEEERAISSWCVKHYPQGDAACAKVLSDDVIEHPRHGPGKRLLLLRCRHRDILGCTFRMKIHRAEDGSLMAYVRGKHEDHALARELGKMSTLPHGATATVDRCFANGLGLEETIETMRKECPHLLSGFEDRQLKTKVRNRRGYLVKKRKRYQDNANFDDEMEGDPIEQET